MARVLLYNTRHPINSVRFNQYTNRLLHSLTVSANYDIRDASVACGEIETTPWQAPKRYTRTAEIRRQDYGQIVCQGACGTDFASNEDWIVGGVRAGGINSRGDRRKSRFLNAQLLK